MEINFEQSPLLVEVKKDHGDIAGVILLTEDQYRSRDKCISNVWVGCVSLTSCSSFAVPGQCISRVWLFWVSMSTAAVALMTSASHVSTVRLHVDGKTSDTKPEKDEKSDMLLILTLNVIIVMFLYSLCDKFN